MRRPGAAVGQQIDLFAQHVLQGGRAALVGDGVELHAGGLCELLHAHMGGAADAGVRIGDDAGLGLGLGHDIAQGLEGRARGHGNAEGLTRRAREIGEVLERVDLHRAQLGEARHRDRDLADGVAVGTGRGQGLGAYHAGGAGAVFERNGLTQFARRDLADDAHRAIGRAARGPRTDEGERALGVLRGERTRRNSGQGCGTEATEHDLAPCQGTGCLHRCLRMVVVGSALRIILKIMIAFQ
ncbi:hypothetical protein D3C78_1241860 [compost metagenome]